MFFLAAATAAIVDLVCANTVTFQEALQFGLPTDTWVLAPNFKMEIKADRSDPTAIIAFSTALGTIVVDDPVQRTIHFNVAEAAIQAALPVGEYVYDLVMFDGSAPPIRTLLAQGRFFVTQGVTES